MLETLESFHFNARKSGQIFKQLCKERGVSQAALAAQTGVSYDTVGNVLAGKIQDIQFERVFKFCAVLGVPIEVYMLLMLKDEEIDFRDQVLLYNPAKDESTPVSDVPDKTPSPVTEAVAAAAQAATVPQEMQEIVPEGRNMYTRDDLVALLNRMERQHAQHIAHLQEQFAQERAAAREYHDRTHALLAHVIGKE